MEEQRCAQLIEPIDNVGQEFYYEKFDLESYAQRREHELSRSLQGDRDKVAPVGRSWLNVTVRIPDTLATVTMLSIGIYEVLVFVAMFVASLRSAMVEGGLMYALWVLNGLLLVVLALVVVVVKSDLNIGMITSRLHRARPEGLDS